jgi:hypothetical protein
MYGVAATAVRLSRGGREAEGSAERASSDHTFSVLRYAMLGCVSSQLCSTK